jgi:rhamnogalacturonyl hydrolase YesR
MGVSPVKWIPQNQQLAAGRMFIVLWKLTGNSAYRQKAEALARHFKSHLRVDPAGGYEWDYWYDRGKLVTAPVRIFRMGPLT